VIDLLDVEDVRAGVGAAVAAHLRTLFDELSVVGADHRLADALTTMTGGGKRLRAAFCYWSWRAHGGQTSSDEDSHDRAPGDPASDGAATREMVLALGAALELFQAAALFHDDVMDDSDTRRGRPAAHRAFAQLHTSQGWIGPAEKFGESVAILLGDLALIAAERVFASAVAGLAPDVRREVTDVFGRMRTEVIAGQYLDLLAQTQPIDGDPVTQEAGARTVVRAKSARYSVEHPLALGAAAAGADDDARRRVARIGLPLGEAFQLRDDLLGVFGDPGTTGKPAGDDLREGKRTVLVARALRDAVPADRALLVAALGHRDLSGTQVDELRDVLRRAGADAGVETLIRELADPALAELAAAPLTDPGRSMLVALARAAVDRHS